MLRPVALALFGLALVAGCSGNSQPFTEGEGGEASGAESSGGSSGENGGTSGAAGNSSGGDGASSGASGDGGSSTGGLSNGGTGAGGTEAGGTDAGGTGAGGTDAGGTDAGGTGGAQGGDAGLGGIGARAGASGSAGAGGSAGATMTDPKCPVRKPESMSSCAPPGLRCPYDPTGCRCLSVIADRCFQVDTGCFAMAPGTGARIAPPPAQYCVCSPTEQFQGWDCASLPL